MKLTIIGNGAMALSIAKGLPKNIEIEVVGKTQKKLQDFAKECNCDYAMLSNYDINDKEIILAVKPYALEDVAKQLQGKANALYSVLAGTTLQALQAIPSKHYVRTMPNVGASYNSSTTSLTGDIAYKEKALQLFSSIGKTYWVENETQLDIATAIAGCGPAFLALIAEGMSDGAVKCGMDRALADELVASNFYSFAPLIANEHPAIIKDKITSPGGTTIEGVKTLEKHGVRFAFFEAVESAYARLKK